MGELIERPFPAAPEAEAYTLGSILTGVRNCEVVFDRLRPEDFFNNQNRRIYTAILQIREAGKTPIYWRYMTSWPIPASWRLPVESAMSRS